MILVLNTLHKSWLLSLIFSPLGRDKREGAGCENPFSTACWSEAGKHADWTKFSGVKKPGARHQNLFRLRPLSQEFTSFLSVAGAFTSL
jgi:hypothetical protein